MKSGQNRKIQDPDSKLICNVIKYHQSRSDVNRQLAPNIELSLSAVNAMACVLVSNITTKQNMAAQTSQFVVYALRTILSRRLVREHFLMTECWRRQCELYKI